MKLIKITNKGSLHFRLTDGRLGVCYESGYVRVQTKGKNMYHGRHTMYQINKMIKVLFPTSWNPENINYDRVKINNCVDRIQRLLDFDNKNCQPKPTDFVPKWKHENLLCAMEAQTEGHEVKDVTVIIDGHKYKVKDTYEYNTRYGK